MYPLTTLELKLTIAMTGFWLLVVAALVWFLVLRPNLIAFRAGLTMLTDDWYRHAYSAHADYGQLSPDNLRRDNWDSTREWAMMRLTRWRDRTNLEMCERAIAALARLHLLNQTDLSSATRLTTNVRNYQ